MDYSLPDSSVHGILQTRILERVAMSSSWGFSQPRDQIHISSVSCISRRVLYHQLHLGSPVYDHTTMKQQSQDSNSGLSTVNTFSLSLSLSLFLSARITTLEELVSYHPNTLLATSKVLTKNYLA